MVVTRIRFGHREVSPGIIGAWEGYRLYSPGNKDARRCLYIRNERWI